jgi:hypothetical protein
MLAVTQCMYGVCVAGELHVHVQYVRTSSSLRHTYIAAMLCPSSLQANILSSHRSFLRRVDVLDIGNPGKGTKGDPLTIFIFSDSLEVYSEHSDPQANAHTL